MRQQLCIVNCVLTKSPSLRGFLTPRGAAFRMHRVLMAPSRNVFYSKSCEQSSSKSLLTQDFYLGENSCELVVSRERVVVSGRFWSFDTPPRGKGIDIRT